MKETLQILTILLSGAAIASVVYLLFNLAALNDLKKRFSQIVKKSWTPEESTLSRKANVPKVAPVVKTLSQLSLPKEGWQSSDVQLKFLRAGIRNKNAPQYYFFFKTLLAMVLPVLLGLYLFFTQPQIHSSLKLLIVLLTAGLGYYLPELVLRFITSNRVNRMRDSLPDMMDLMVVCTESGMGVDASISRISNEMRKAAPELAEEFYLAVLEMRAGANRLEAFRNLALRSTLKELEDLVSMLVQADKFGTSMAESLRVHSEVMRTNRIQRAEEIAAKIPVKLVLPLGLFIFPTLIIVLLGPAGIQLLQQLTSR